MTKLVLVSSLSATPTLAAPLWGEKEALAVLSDGGRSPHDRARAARRLHTIHAQSAVVPMIALLDRIGEDVELSAAVRDAVRGLGGLEYLVAQLADPREETRHAAVSGLSRLGDQPARTELRRVATCDPAPKIRRTALTALAAGRPSSEDVATALGALSDADAEVRQSAAIVLGASGPNRASGALDALTRARAGEEDAFVVYFYDRAIKRLQQRGN